ncbi:MAG: ADP-forming succinate--CoA ligase subunit beta [Candidatus Korobacteraceae bacterium]
MRLFEHEGREIFAKFGINVPKAALAGSVEEALRAVETLGYPVVIKAQVLSGGRGKAGGVKIANNQAELIEHTGRILGLTIKGEKTESVLLSEKTEIARELYAGVTFDPQNGLPVLMFSTSGGMDIEEVARTAPEKVLTMHLPPTQPVRAFRIIDLLRRAGLPSELLPKLAPVMQKLIEVFHGIDATTAEINPLVITPKEEIVAIDSKIVIDDSSLARQHITPRWDVSTPLEARAKAAGLNYVQLEGNIAVLGSGAGLAMATMDLIQHYGAKPACFLDTGGGIQSDKMAEAFRICLATPGVEGVLVNAFGGINNCEWMGRGLANVIDEDKPTAKILVKMRGHSQDEGWKLLEDRNIPIVKFGTTEEAVEQMVGLVASRQTQQQRLPGTPALPPQQRQKTAVAGDPGATTPATAKTAVAGDPAARKGA